MHPIRDRDLPRPTAISVAALRRLLADLPDTWQIISDDSARYVLIDEDEQPRGYVDIEQARVVFIDGLSDEWDS